MLYITFRYSTGGADLFESIVAEIISAMIHGGTMAQPCKLERLVGIITAYVFVWINKSQFGPGINSPSIPQDWWMNPRAQMMGCLLIMLWNCRARRC
ncbi:hypothetical protein ACOSP7_001458 [Xanthoceras sorbifolium]